MANIGSQRRYMESIKRQIESNDKVASDKDINLPGLPNTESQVAIPMLVEDELIGVFAVESDQINIFDKFFQIIFFC